MNAVMMRTLFASATLALMTACGQSADQHGNTPATVIQIDGSSTVYPITEAIVEDFQRSTGGTVRVTVGVSGTGGGMKKFCRGELDIANASRPIQRQEMEACAAAGVNYFELPVAYDALTVVVNPQSPVSEVTVDELKTLWRPEAQGTVTRWNQVNPAWPDSEIKLYGAGADSGTFDYFTEAVVGKAKSSRGDYTASEDDNVLVQGIAGDVGAMGYFGFAYYYENRDKLKALAIKATPDSPAVHPTPENVINGTYMPLSRPMFIYVSDKAWQRPEVKQFLAFYFDNATRLVTEVDFVPLPESAYTLVIEHLAANRLGTVFKGEAATAVTIEDLLRRERGN